VIPILPPPADMQREVDLGIGGFSEGHRTAMGSGHFNVLLRPRRQLFQFNFPPLLNPLKLDVNGRPFPAAVHIPQVDNVTLHGNELDEVHIDV